MLFLQVSTDTAIAAAYLAISLTLGWLLFRIRDIPFRPTYLAFGVFIVACGLTHLLDVWVIWHPNYWLDAGLQAITAIASIGTAFGLPPLVPRVEALVRGARDRRRQREPLDYAAADLSQRVRVALAHFEAFAVEREIAVARELPERLPAQFDPRKIDRVLLNLLSNAFQLTPRRGRVRVSLIRREDRGLLEVADSGPGVPEPVRQAVFERVCHPLGGIGLGLAIVRELVELHGGSVTVDAAPEGGARFVVCLPPTAPEGTLVSVSGTPEKEREQGEGSSAGPTP